jgi:hypothetical protein
MNRRSLARVVPVLLLLLLLGSFAVAAIATTDASPAAVHLLTPSDRDHSPAIGPDVGANDALAVAASRTSDDTGRSANRLFAIALAALVTLAALLAMRHTRSVVAFAAHRDAPLASRRRGPPRLRCA